MGGHAYTSRGIYHAAITIVAVTSLRGSLRKVCARSADQRAILARRLRDRARFQQVDAKTILHPRPPPPPIRSRRSRAQRARVREPKARGEKLVQRGRNGEADHVEAPRIVVCIVDARVTRVPLRVACTTRVLSPAARPVQTAFNQFAVAARSLMPF